MAGSSLRNGSRRETRRGLGWEEPFHPPAPTSGGKRGWGGGERRGCCRGEPWGSAGSGLPGMGWMRPFPAAALAKEPRGLWDPQGVQGSQAPAPSREHREQMLPKRHGRSHQHRKPRPCLAPCVGTGFPMSKLVPCRARCWLPRAITEAGWYRAGLGSGASQGGNHIGVTGEIPKARHPLASHMAGAGVGVRARSHVPGPCGGEL